MNFKSKKALALLMSSAMAATLIFANTVKAMDGRKIITTITATWHLGNGEFKEGTRKLIVDVKGSDTHFRLFESLGHDNDKLEIPIKYFFDEYGRAYTINKESPVSIIIGGDIWAASNDDHKNDDHKTVYLNKGQKYDESDIKLDIDVTEANIIRLADYAYYDKHLDANNEPIETFESVDEKSLEANQKEKFARIDVKLAEPIQKEEKNELLKKEFIKQFGVVKFHDITYKEPDSEKEKYWLMYMDEQGAKVADAIMQNSNDAIYEPINLLDLQGNNANRFKLFLYDDSAHKYITVNQGNNEDKLNLLDEGAFDNVENGNYKLIIDIDYGDSDISLADEKTNITPDQKFQNNVVLDATFDFHLKKEPVVTESTLTVTDSTPKLIHVTFNDEYNKLHQISIQAGDKLLPSQAPTPVKEGYEFLGWYYKASDEYKLGPRGLEDELLPFNFDRSIYTDFDLYAKWKKVEVEEKRPVPNTADC